MADLTRKAANLVDQNVFATTYTNYVTSANGIITFNSVTSAMNSDGVTVDIPANTVFTCIPLEVTNGIISFRIRFEGETEQDRQMVYLYDSNGEPNTIAPVTLSFAVKKITIFWSNASGKTAAFKNFMVNAGSNPLPYEPYGWVHSLRKQCSATETIQSGDTIYANGQPISTYSIEGNTVQSGTPTPSNPVAVNGVGERTENLLQISDMAETTRNGVTYHVKGNSLYIDGTSTSAFGFNLRGAFTLKAGTYTNQMYGFEGNRMYYSFNNVNTTMCTSDVNLYKTFTISEDTTYANALVWINNGVVFNNEKIDFALFESEVPKDFEPYGYKIPISSGQTVNNYLGSIQSTRQIQKLELTGNEDWNISLGVFYLGTLTNDYLRSTGDITYISTHYQPYQQQSSAGSVPDGYFGFGNSTAVQRLYVHDSNYSTTDAFKAYLQAQYAAGTPVTVWYVLATATTDTVNEPLMKIGDYADSISDATAIPTTDGANTITVDTTVQPSEVSMTWTGWHDSSVKEYDGSDWQ